MSVGTACADVDALLAERASGSLPPGDRSRLEAHLAGCGRCRAELELYEEAFGILRQTPELAQAAEGEPGLAPSTLRRWKRSRRRRAIALAAGPAAIAAAALLVLAPGLGGVKRSGQPPASQAKLAEPASWEPDVDGALEASGLQREAAQDEEWTTVDVALAALDAADEEP